MKLFLFGILALSCVPKQNAQLVKDDPADLETLMVEVISLRGEMAEERKLRGRLEDEMAEEKKLRGKLEDEMAEEKKLRGKLEDEMAEEKKLRLKLEDEMAADRRLMESELAAERKIRGHEIAALNEADAATKDMIQSLNEHIAQNVTEQIAFFVHSQSEFGPVTVTTKIPFPYENVNIGGGWQPHIDAFQAPVAGHYFFFASIMSFAGTSPNVRIIHTPASGDIIVVGLLSSGSNYNGDANTVILSLEEGDYVSVQLNSGGGGIVFSSGAKYTTFSGFLLT